MSKTITVLASLVLLSSAFSPQFALAQNRAEPEKPKTGVRKDINHYDRTDKVTDLRRIRWGKRYDSDGTGFVSSIAVEIHMTPDESPEGVLYVNTFDTEIRGYRETSYGPPDFRTRYTGVVRCNDSPYKFSFRNGESKTGKLFSGAHLSFKEFRDGVENECYEYLFRGQLRFVDDDFYHLASKMTDKDRLRVRLTGNQSLPNIDLSADQIDDMVYMIKKSRQWLETNQAQFVANAYDEEDERQQRARIALQIMKSAKQRYESFKVQYEFIKKREEEHQEMMNSMRGSSMPRINLGYESEDTFEPRFDYNRGIPRHLPTSETPMVADARRRMEQARDSFVKAKREYKNLANPLQRSGGDNSKSREEAGTWKCAAGDFMPLYQLNEDGTFLAYFEKNGTENPTLKGNWSRDGVRLSFKASGEPATVSKAEYEGNNKFRLNGFNYERQQ